MYILPVGVFVDVFMGVFVALTRNEESNAR